jgi:hypothetical protein
MRFDSAGLFLVVALLGCQSAPASSASAAASSRVQATSDRRAEAQAVVAAVERVFSSMRTRDTAALRGLLDARLVIVAHGTAADGSTRVSQRTVSEFLGAVAASPAELRERMWTPEVRVDGSLATVWAPYDFHVGERFSHCGHDAVHLARRDGRWIITALAYTVEHTGCGPASTAK